ncbi:MAG TPA: high frequency lysogenization protein HflD [Dokdonella sp.]|uniref:high frequency lysogenization protein HflD n=1 Tax=Dokdonella sp. TaxID=2291710 RepID=UPI002C5D5579|nr:high frequency lysogenization protein HflD [Dokdonella sp.]HUD43325.1 high frequency lysogenization protein HflD [Dokdonella sp.]
MRESRVIALAGVFQACTLVRGVAVDGRCDAQAAQASIASVLRIDADTPQAVFGGVSGIRLGLEALIRQIEGGDRDLQLTQLVVAALRLERKLSRRPAMLETLRRAIESAQRQAEHFGIDSPSLTGRLAGIYADTLSTLRPRIVVHGNPLQLSQEAKVEQIRALLLAAIRAAVLWRQVGGNQWRLLFRRREYAMLARGLLARATLDAG